MFDVVLVSRFSICFPSASGDMPSSTTMLRLWLPSPTISFMLLYKALVESSVRSRQIEYEFACLGLTARDQNALTRSLDGLDSCHCLTAPISPASTFLYNSC